VGYFVIEQRAGPVVGYRRRRSIRWQTSYDYGGDSGYNGEMDAAKLAGGFERTALGLAGTITRGSRSDKGMHLF
jgi:hypothetical protein